MHKIHDLQKMFIQPPIHDGMKYANTLSEWSHNDSERNFKANMAVKSKQKLIQAQGWDQPNAITYDINSQGFRCNELQENRNAIVFLGCSHTYGVGLPIQNTYVYNLSTMLDMPYFNLGIPGSALDTAFRMACYWLHIIKPKIVVCFHGIYRMEHRISSDDMNVFLCTDGRELSKSWFCCDENSEYNGLKNFLAIESICKDISADFYAWRTEHEFNQMGPTDQARDIMHFGPRAHEKLAEKMYQEIVNE